jgi:hypothetical protein
MSISRSFGVGKAIYIGVYTGWCMLCMELAFLKRCL